MVDVVSIIPAEYVKHIQETWLTYRRAPCASSFWLCEQKCAEVSKRELLDQDIFDGTLYIEEIGSRKDEKNKFENSMGRKITVEERKRYDIDLFTLSPQKRR
jgi:hypothetical protein